MSKLQELKESLIMNGRKPVSKRSIKLFSEAQGVLKESVQPDYDDGDGYADFTLTVYCEFNEIEDGDIVDTIKTDEYYSFDFGANSKAELNDIIVNKVRSLGSKEIKEMSDKEIISHVTDPFNNGTILVHKEEYKDMYFDNIGENESVELSFSILCNDYAADKWVMIGEDISLDEVFGGDMNESQSRRKPVVESQRKSSARTSKSKQALLESLAAPISGMEYRVYKKGAGGQGRGQLVDQGTATVRGQAAYVNGKKYDFSKYAFDGTKGY
jgi:hypothetical protein